MERVKEGPEEPIDPKPGDYFVVSSENSCWYVSTEMARHIDECLETVPRLPWIVFVDLTGARVRMRVDVIEYLSQCTADQRSAEREFFRNLKRERKADRSWEEED